MSDAETGFRDVTIHAPDKIARLKSLQRSSGIIEWNGGREMCKITVNVDDEQAKAFKKVLANLGISISSALRLYVDAVIKEGDIPKDIDPFYSPENLEQLRKSADELEKGLSSIHPLVEA